MAAIPIANRNIDDYALIWICSQPCVVFLWYHLNWSDCVPRCTYDVAMSHEQLLPRDLSCLWNWELANWWILDKTLIFRRWIGTNFVCMKKILASSWYRRRARQSRHYTWALHRRTHHSIRRCCAYRLRRNEQNADDVSSIHRYYKFDGLSGSNSQPAWWTADTIDKWTLLLLCR